MAAVLVVEVHQRKFALRRARNSRKLSRIAAPMHLFADISGHGLGHLAISARFSTLARKRTDLRLTIRSAILTERLRQRIGIEFTHWQQASDFGFRMLDALSVDRIAGAAEYRRSPCRLGSLGCPRRGHHLRPRSRPGIRQRQLPGAGGSHCRRVPAIAACSLNWADLLPIFLGARPGLPHPCRNAGCLPLGQRLPADHPGMPMAKLARSFPSVSLPALVVLATLGSPPNPGGPPGPRGNQPPSSGGGLPTRPDIFWIPPEEWRCRRADTRSVESFGLAFPDLLASVDAVVTKPGYPGPSPKPR